LKNVSLFLKIDELGTPCHLLSSLSTTTFTNITGFNTSKEYFIWFVKRATSDRKSDAHAELYHIAAIIAPHPILDHVNTEGFITFLKNAVQPGTAEYTEMFWYLVDWIIFPTMVERILETPKKLAVEHG
jgi:hypothetical protein